MVFKRRNKLSWGRWFAEGIYPRSGWKRATSYIMHRIRRLPDSPGKIARGIGVGVWVSFTPFFGMHFVIAMLLAALMRGNIIAALLATFFGNPLTFPFIATGSLKLGHWILGSASTLPPDESVFQVLRHASWDLAHNFAAIFTSQTADWSGFGALTKDVVLPYFIGGLGPGLVLGVTFAFLSRPLIAAYQHRRRGRLTARWHERRAARTARKKGGETPSAPAPERNSR